VEPISIPEGICHMRWTRKRKVGVGKKHATAIVGQEANGVCLFRGVIRKKKEGSVLHP